MTSSFEPPLKGVRVVELTHTILGPSCGMILADLGAEVIKVEPVDGDRTRKLRGFGAGFFGYFNRNKKSLALDADSAEGRAALVKLLQSADVLIENFAPGVLDRLGAGWDVLHERNPRLCYGSGSGYGLSGPDRDRLAMDLTVQAYGGAMSVTGFPDGPPVKAGPQIVDFLGGVHLYAGLMTALFEREHTGVGHHVEVAMQEVTLMSMASNWGTLIGTGSVGRTGNRHSGLAVAPYNVYPTTDGAIALMCTAEEHWTNLANAMGRPELIEDPRYVDNGSRAAHLDEVDELVGAWTAPQAKADVFAACQRYRVPAAPVRTLVEVLHDDHLRQREAIRDIEHPSYGTISLPQSPLRFDHRPPPRLSVSPGFGQHNAEVYGSLGLDVDTLRADGVI